MNPGLPGDVWSGSTDPVALAGGGAVTTGRRNRGFARGRPADKFFVEDNPLRESVSRRFNAARQDREWSTINN